MKDFTEITLCPEALERSKVGLGQGCHPMGLHSAVPTVPRTIAFVQTEFCNPVFEGEEPLAVPPAEQPTDEDGVGATSPQDALGTCMEFVHVPMSMGPLGAQPWGALCGGVGMCGESLAFWGREAGLRGWHRAGDTAAPRSALSPRPPQAGSSGCRRAGSTVPTAGSPGSAWL